MGTNFTIRPYTPDDASAVREVLEATYGAQAPPQQTIDWLWFGCPEAAGGSMVAEAKGKVVGVQPMEILRFTDGGHLFKGGLLTGVAVHPAFRRQGIFSALVQTCETEAWQQGADFVTTMPNERSRPGFLKMGYTDLGRRRLLMRLLDARALGRATASVPMLGWLVGAVAARGQTLLKALPRGGAHTVREVREVDAELEAVEQDHAGLFPGLRLQRNAAWWRWRYVGSPQRYYRLFEARSQAGRLTGVAALYAEVRNSMPMAYLMDVAVRSREALVDILMSVFEAARADGVCAVCAVASAPYLTRALCQSGFWAMPLWIPVKRFYTVVRFNPASAHRVPGAWREIVGWYQMLGDWDNL